MPRAKLTEPSYKNGYAHDAASSANPSIFPTYAWVPRLGHSGTEVPEVNRGASMSMGSMTPEAGWQIDRYGYKLTGDGTATDSLTTVNTFGQDAFTEFTLVCTYSGAFSASKGMFGRSGTSVAGAFSFQTFFLPNIWLFQVEGSIGVQSASAGENASFFDNNEHTLVGVRYTNGFHDLYIDGNLEASNTTDTGDLTPAAPIGWDMLTAGLLEYPGSLSVALFYDRALNLNELKHISEDIMAPFRLKSRPIPA